MDLSDADYTGKVEVELGVIMSSEDAPELPCPTCLSHGRALSPLREAARAYCMLLAGLRQEDVEELVTYTMLCWECCSFVERMLRFQEQVLHANILMRALVGDETERQNKTFSALASVMKVGFDRELEYEAGAAAAGDERAAGESVWDEVLMQEYEGGELVEQELEMGVEESSHLPQQKSEVRVEAPSGRGRRRKALKRETPVRKSARRSRAPPQQDDTLYHDQPIKQECQKPEPRARQRTVVRTIGSWPGKKVLLKGRKKNVKIVSMLMPEEEMLRFRAEDRTNPQFLKYPFRCDTCIKGFTFVNLLERHNASNHAADAGPHQCNICCVYLSTEEQLVRHHKKHYNLYVCSACGYAHRLLPDVFKHYTSVHECGKTYPCDACDQHFPSARKMRYHREITHKEVYKCEYCAKVMRNSQSFKSHLLIHTGMPMLQCSICQKSCRGDTGLYAHMRTAHNRENAEDAYCTECNIQFKNKSIYRSHLKTSVKHATPAQLKFSCDKCDKKFISETALKQHVRYYHMIYSCTICSKRLNNWYSLDKHVKFVHEGREMPRKHICETCGKGFKTRRALDSHQMTHTGERPHACDLCGSTFAQKSTLRTHRRLVHFKIKKEATQAVVSRVQFE